ncbi:hypothetical protein C1645_737101 [Glomus cerebriforme]|uniref:Myb/SANT-like DNA-binding domain-containing protein n=1 Tax=Glomus cerebriforme TaxID=658196 RepID=A0A397T575_9GLOM|nr:hypothetical protein C1645_737101 [Glomus cerebriforme]
MNTERKNSNDINIVVTLNDVSNDDASKNNENNEIKSESLKEKRVKHQGYLKSESVSPGRLQVTPKKIRKFLAMWTDEHLRVLIDSRKDYNEKYYDLVGNGKRNFWKQVSTKINLQFGTSYSGAHCMEKFESLKRDHKLMKDYIDGKDKGKKTKNGLKYYEEFLEKAWKI